jgi:hypothetical protein
MLVVCCARLREDVAVGVPAFDVVGVGVGLGVGSDGPGSDGAGWDGQTNPVCVFFFRRNPAAPI